jgi:hypothetical protein
MLDADDHPRPNRVADLDHATLDERKTTVLIDQDRVYSRQGFSERWYRWRLRLGAGRSDGSLIG